MRLENKVAIVTGAAGGIGRASVLRFAQEGARVAAADIQALNQAADGTAQNIVAGEMEAGDVLVAALAAVGIFFIVLVIAAS